MLDEKNYVLGETRLPGGNGINAARIVHRLGFPVELTGFLGGGVGVELKGLMDEEGLNSRFISIIEPTRISVTVSDLASHHQTRLSFSGPNISPNEKEKLLSYARNLPRGSLVIVGGSLPPGMTPKILGDLFQILSENNCPFAIDVPGPILGQILNDVFASQFPALLIKPNLTEFQEALGTKATTLKEVVDSAKSLLDKIPLICVSSVNGGAVLVSNHGTWFGQIPEVKVKSSVGAGDSMVGAMCTLLNQWTFKTQNDREVGVAIKHQGQDLLRWGLAAACATLCVDGTQLGQKKEIEVFFKQIRIESI